MYLKSLLSVALFGLYRKSGVRSEGSVSSKINRVKVLPKKYIRMKQLLHGKKEIALETNHWSEILNQRFGAKTKMSQKWAAPRIARAEEILDHLAESLQDFGKWYHTHHMKIYHCSGPIFREKEKMGLKKTGFIGKAHLPEGLWEPGLGGSGVTIHS